MNEHASVSSGVRVLNFDLSLRLHLIFVYASSVALASLRICADSLESSLFDNDTKITCAGS